jgi:hypothetical protein
LWALREEVRVLMMTVAAHTILNFTILFSLLKTQNDLDVLKTKNPDEKSSGFRMTPWV